MGIETQLNELFVGGGLGGMLEGKNHKNVDMAFSFVARFIY